MMSGRWVLLSWGFHFTDGQSRKTEKWCAARGKFWQEMTIITHALLFLSAKLLLKSCIASPWVFIRASFKLCSFAWLLIIKKCVFYWTGTKPVVTLCLLCCVHSLVAWNHHQYWVRAGGEEGGDRWSRPWVKWKNVTHAWHTTRVQCSLAPSITEVLLWHTIPSFGLRVLWSLITISQPNRLNLKVCTFVLKSEYCV